MKTISIKIDPVEKDKTTSFIKLININVEMAAYSENETTIFVAAIGECGISLARAFAARIFDNEVIITTIK